MYGQFPGKGYAVSVPNNKQSKFGTSLTSRCRQSKVWTNTCYIDSGSARMETDEKTVIGELNGEATWINGRLEIEKDSGRIFYRKYDDKGNLVKNSTLEFVNFQWLNSSKGKAAQRSNTFSSAMPKKPVVDKDVADKNQPAKRNAALRSKTFSGKRPTLRRPNKPDAEKEKDAANKNKASTEKLKGTKNVAPETKKERKPSTKLGDDAPSSTTSTIKLTGADAESYLKDIGINLEAFSRNGSSNRTITLTKNTTILGNTR